jgi:hypothetical protein
MFVKDAKEGEGTLIFNDASSYNGGFKNNRFNGKGTFCTKDNTIYVGDWYHGRKNGQGCETLSDGRYVYRINLFWEKLHTFRVSSHFLK